jgi:hypothetical protein
MLDKYFSMEGHLYIGATMENIPWIFLYLSLNQTLYKRTILRDSLAFNAIKDNVYGIVFENTENEKYVTIEPQPEAFLNLNFSFLAHERKRRDGQFLEVISFCIYQDEKEVFKEKIVLNTDWFFNLVEYDEWIENNRNKKLLELAKEYL